jgi:hypothetical protein
VEESGGHRGELDVRQQPVSITLLWFPLPQPTIMGANQTALDFYVWVVMVVLL